MFQGFDSVFISALILWRNHLLIAVTMDVTKITHNTIIERIQHLKTVQIDLSRQVNESCNVFISIYCKTNLCVCFYRSRWATTKGMTVCTKSWWEGRVILFLMINHSLPISLLILWPQASLIIPCPPYRTARTFDLFLNRTMGVVNFLVAVM